MMGRIGLSFAVMASVLLISLPGTAAQKGEQTPSEKEFCRLDRDNDRVITFEEFASCEFYRLERVRKLPDTDGTITDGKGRQLSDEEMKSYLFNKADKNKDRKIDRKEWEEFYESIMSIH